MEDIMAKKTRIDELFEAGIDYSVPIDRFARKAMPLLNRLAKKMKNPIRSGGAEYNDGGARIYVNGRTSAKFLTAYEKAVRKLAREHKELKKLKLPVVSVELGGYEIFISFC